MASLPCLNTAAPASCASATSTAATTRRPRGASAFAKAGRKADIELAARLRREADEADAS